MKCNTNTDTVRSSPANVKKVDAIFSELVMLENRQNLSKKDIKRIEKLNKDLRKLLSKKKVKMGDVKKCI